MIFKKLLNFSTSRYKMPEMISSLSVFLFIVSVGLILYDFGKNFSISSILLLSIVMILYNISNLLRDIHYNYNRNSKKYNPDILIY